MQEAAHYRIAELIPTVRIEAVEKEEEELKKAQARLAIGGGSLEIQRKAQEAAHTPIRKEEKTGRNEFVTITNGTDTETMKFKKAEPLLASGEWQVVEK